MIKLTIVIPLYNEAKVVEEQIKSLLTGLSKSLPTISTQVVLVENGSRDETAEIAKRITRENSSVKLLSLPKPAYGMALKRGIIASESNYVALFNVDFWNIGFLQEALTLLEEKQYDMVIGSKLMPGAQDFRSFFRRSLTRFFNNFLKIFFGFRGTDTHGLKVFSKERFVSIVKRCTTEYEVFDTELILRAQRAGNKIVEIPVNCREIRRSTYGVLRRIPRTLKDLAYLYFQI